MTIFPGIGIYFWLVVRTFYRQLVEMRAESQQIASGFDEYLNQDQEDLAKSKTELENAIRSILKKNPWQPKPEMAIPKKFDFPLVLNY